MESIFLLTGPNGGGKSSLLRAICAAALLSICGLMVPAESAVVPHFDSIMLHVKSYDSPADGKSSFQVTVQEYPFSTSLCHFPYFNENKTWILFTMQIEMSELRSMINGTSSRSLVLVDEICRGTETVKGTCIAGSIIETLDSIGCLGIISTHLHGIFDLSLTTRNVVNKAMGTEEVNGRIKPTWKLVDGICKESLAFETALKEGLPDKIIKRAREIYLSSENGVELSHTSESVDFDLVNVEKAVIEICHEKLAELHRRKTIANFSQVSCSYIGEREQPPPSTIGSSSIYILFRPDERLYVGQVLSSLSLSVFLLV